jgi:hypothetical protein
MSLVFFHQLHIGDLGGGPDNLFVQDCSKRCLTKEEDDAGRCPGVECNLDSQTPESNTDWVINNRHSLSKMKAFAGVFHPINSKRSSSFATWPSVKVLSGNSREAIMGPRPMACVCQIIIM